MFLMQKRRFWLVEMEVCYSVCKLNMGVCTHCSRLWWITEVLQTSLFYLVAPRFFSLFFLTSACKWRSWLIWLFVRNYCLALCLFFMRKIETEIGCYEWIKRRMFIEPEQSHFKNRITIWTTLLQNVLTFRNVYTSCATCYTLLQWLEEREIFSL